MKSWKCPYCSCQSIALDIFEGKVIRDYKVVCTGCGKDIEGVYTQWKKENVHTVNKKN